MKKVRIYTDYFIDDEDGTLSDDELISRAYAEMDEQIEHGYFCLDQAEVLEN